MSVLVNKNTRVICQGFTGSHCTFHSEQSIFQFYWYRKVMRNSHATYQVHFFRRLIFMVAIFVHYNFYISERKLQFILDILIDYFIFVHYVFWLSERKLWFTFAIFIDYGNSWSKWEQSDWRCIKFLGELVSRNFLKINFLLF